MSKVIVVCLITLLLTGCGKVGPDYKRSDLKTDAKFEGVPAQGHAEAIRIDWWANFEDAQLDSLIKKATEDSYDLKILFGRIKAAGAMVDQSESALYPSVNFDSNATFTKSAQDGRSKSYEANAALSWELDLWGKNRRTVEAAEADQQAVKADYRAGYLRLTSDTALAYFAIRQYDSLERIANNFISNNTVILRIYEQQYKEGIVGIEEVYRQRALINELRSEALETQRGRAVQEHKLAALTGQPPGDMKIQALGQHKLMRPLTIPTGLPSALLDRRPDILAAEYRLVKATHQIGIAEAARLPSIGLSARGGFASSSLATLLTGGIASFMPTIRLPIFDAGKSKAEVERARHEVEVAKNEWAKTANDAFAEVADSLTNLANRKKQQEVLLARVADMQKIQNQMKNRLELGLISQLELIDTEQTLYTAKKTLVQMNTMLLSDTVLLYKALGGGWSTHQADSGSPGKKSS